MTLTTNMYFSYLTCCQQYCMYPVTCLPIPDSSHNLIICFALIYVCSMFCICLGLYPYMMTNDLQINSRCSQRRWNLGCEMTSEINTNRKKALWSARLVSSWSLIEDMEVMQANQIRLLSKGHAMRCCIIMWHLYKYRNPAVVADYATTAKIWPLFAPLVELSRTVIIHGDKPEPSPKKVLPPLLRIL